MSAQPLNTFTLVLLAVFVFISNSALATSFSVSQFITVSGVTSGSGSGSGTATLDTNAGTLTLNLNSTTVTGFTNTTVETVATVTGSYTPDSLSSVSGNSQLISCTNNGGLVNGCGSVTSDFGTVFLTDPIDFDLSLLGVTTFTVQDSNSGANIQQVFTLITGGTPPPGPPATIDLTSGGPTQYTFDPGNGHSVTLSIAANSGNVTQDSSGLGNDSGGFLEDGAVDNYWVGSTQETLIFTFSESVILDSVALDLFEPIALPERAELSLDGGSITIIDESSASQTGGDLSNWEYLVGTEVTSFTLGTPVRGAIGDSTFRINSLVVSAPPPVDSDGDGLTDDVETNTGVFVDGNDTGSDPFDNDSDDDGLLDGAEVALGTNPVDNDSDDDGLLDGAELGAGTDPLDSDSDDDGVSDGDEVAGGTDPNVSQLNCDIDPVAGLSLGDVLLLQRHLNDSELLSANEQIFCDLDSDASVTLSDLLNLQRQVLGQ